MGAGLASSGLYAVILHLCSLVAISVLMATNTVPVNTGLPILTALIGVAIPSPLA